MNAVTLFMEKYFVPVAAKVGGQKHLVAIRDAFIATLPATMAGSIAVMINAIIRDMPVAFNPDYRASEIPVIREIIGVNGFVWNGTLAVVGLIFAFCWGYNLARAYKVNELAGGIVALSALIQGVAFSYRNTAEISLPQNIVDLINEQAAGAGISATTESLTAAGWGWLRLGHLDGNAYFTIMILGGLATIIYAKLMLKDITIKLPDSVPPAVAKAFTAIIPAAVALYSTAIIYFIFSRTIGADGIQVITWVQQTIAHPFLRLSQGFGATMLVSFLISLLWLFGLHGPNVLGPVLSSIWGQAQMANVNTFQEGGMQAIHDAIAAGNQEGFRWVSGSFDAYAWFGGSGGTLSLILVILLVSKRADYKTVAKLGLGPGIFNINEPVMFGLPIVMNPIFALPFFIAPMVATAIGFFATQFGLVNPVVVAVPWVLPPFLMSFLATGADWRAPIVTLVSFVATIFIWLPFVLAANSQKEVDFD